jgi:predicted ribosomally synthesized peptide with SipW-like signal peptide
MRIRKWAAALAVTALALGLIGAGVAATFTDDATASQTATVGVMDIQLDSSTAGATLSTDGDTLTCPAIHITTASGMDLVGCNVQIKSMGDIQPAQVTVKVQATITNGDLGKFGIAPTGLQGGQLFYWLSNSQQTIGHVFGNQLPANVNVPLSWGEYAGPEALDNDEMGASVVVTYSIESFQ